MTDAIEANPLVHETFRIPFDRIRAEHVEPAIEQLLAQAKAELAAIVAVEGPRTRANTLDAFEAMGRGLDWAMGVVGHLESVATTPELRAAYEAVQPPVSEFSSSVYHDVGLFRALEQFAATPEAATLDPTRARLLHKLRDAFRRNGAGLDAESKQRVSAIDVELAKLTTKFSQNVLDSTNAFELIIPPSDEARLAGLPETARAAARASAERKGVAGWRFTLQEPSLVPILTYADDVELRRVIWQAYNTRASSGELDNRGLIEQILALREDKARLLGFASFADFVLEDRMAKTGARAREFVDDLRARTEGFFTRETAALRRFRAEREGVSIEAAALAPWDVGYWSEQQRRALYDFDEEALRPYFALESVLAGMFELVEKLYGIRVVPVDDLPTWHDEVRTYAVEEGGRRLGCFYADLHPNERKRGGAWMNALFTHEPNKPDAPPHLGLICGNMTAPLDGKPALLNHREVETVFHEFGHLLHHLLSEVEVRSLAGTNVAWDFVELPSQIMENWCWERAALDLFARHHETGERIPDELFDKLIRARNFRSASAMMRQLGFASLDLALHLELAPALLAGREHPALLEFCRAAQQPFAVVELPNDYAMVCGFSHLFAAPIAYASGYYSYKWAEVLDADAFEAFKQQGVFSREVGERFRKVILARGDSRDPAELYREFRGRDPELDPLLIRAGLQAEGEAA
ncbi:M3 family metallopeptidase [Nannocystaceae bacterium ST9]